jgi:hypothetical protein
MWHSYWGIFRYCPQPLFRQVLEQYLKLATAASLHILSNTLSTDHPNILLYEVPESVCKQTAGLRGDLMTVQPQLFQAA